MAEEKRKICPLAYAVGKGTYDQEVASFDNCEEKRCAWWSESTGDCAILMIGNYIATGWLLLDDFLSKKRGK